MCYPQDLGVILKDWFRPPSRLHRLIRWYGFEFSYSTKAMTSESEAFNRSGGDK